MISELINTGLDSSECNNICKKCQRRGLGSVPLKIHRNITQIPNLIAFELTPHYHNIRPDIRLYWHGPNGQESLILCGLIYGGHQHFTSRFIDNTGTVWYHDGMTTGSSCTQERTVTILDDTSWLQKTNEGKTLISCIYRNLKIGRST